MTFCDGGDLFDLIMNGLERTFSASSSTLSKSPHTPDESEASSSASLPSSNSNSCRIHQMPDALRSLLFQLAEGLEYLHDTIKIAHRDIKPENLLFTPEGRLMIGDFGLATAERYSSEYGVGTSYYASPESLGFYYDGSRSEYPSLKAFDTFASDIWSMGIVMLNLVAEQNPWYRADPRRDEAFRAYAMDRTCLKVILPAISDECHELAKWMLALDPKDRCTAAEAKAAISRIHCFTESATKTAQRPYSGDEAYQDEEEVVPNPADSFACAGKRPTLSEFLKLADSAKDVARIGKAEESARPSLRLLVPPCSPFGPPGTPVSPGFGSQLRRTMADKTYLRMISRQTSARGYEKRPLNPPVSPHYRFPPLASARNDLPLSAPMAFPPHRHDVDGSSRFTRSGLQREVCPTRAVSSDGSEVYHSHDVYEHDEYDGDRQASVHIGSEDESSAVSESSSSSGVSRTSPSSESGRFLGSVEMSSRGTSFNSNVGLGPFDASGVAAGGVKQRSDCEEDVHDTHNLRSPFESAPTPVAIEYEDAAQDEHARSRQTTHTPQDYDAEPAIVVEGPSSEDLSFLQLPRTPRAISDDEGHRSADPVFSPLQRAQELFLARHYGGVYAKEQQQQQHWDRYQRPSRQSPRFAPHSARFEYGPISANNVGIEAVSLSAVSGRLHNVGRWEYDRALPTPGLDYRVFEQAEDEYPEDKRGRVVRR